VVDKQTVAALRAMPRRDNTAYHETVAEARQIYQDAESFFDGTSFSGTSAVTAVTSEELVITWTFKRGTDGPRADENVSREV